MGFGPFETVRVTGVPGFRLVPGGAEAFTTSPGGTVSFQLSVTVTAPSRAPATAAVAAARLSPTTVGIGCRSGPRETTASICPPSTILAPGPGWVEITTSLGTDSL